MADFTLNRGDTIELNAVVTASGAVYSLVGRTIWFTAKYAYRNADAAAVFQKTVGSGITITDGPNGRCTVKISPADTEGLPDAKTLLLYDMQVKDPTGNVYTIATGNLIFLPDVTRSR